MHIGSYLHAENSGRIGNQRAYIERSNTTIEQLGRSIQPNYSGKELADVYFYIILVETMGLTRRALDKELFWGREDIVVNYNPQSLAQSGRRTNHLRKEEFEILSRRSEKRKVRKTT